jgi:hypothetical protein
MANFSGNASLELGVDHDIYLQVRQKVPLPSKQLYRHAFAKFGIPSLAVSDFVSPTTDVKIFPNPTTGQFTLQSDESGEYSISNLQGQLVQQGSIERGMNTVTIESDLPNGVYFITIKTKRGLLEPHKLLLTD